MPNVKSLTVVKINWTAVAEKVESLTGKRLDPPYLRAVAKGQRENKQLKPLLNDLLRGLELN